MPEEVNGRIFESPEEVGDEALSEAEITAYRASFDAIHEEVIAAASDDESEVAAPKFWK